MEVGTAVDKKFIFGTSVKQDGPMGTSRAMSSANAENISRFIKSTCGSHSDEIDMKRIVTAELVHGNTVHVVTEKDLGKCIPQCDGLITDIPNVPLFIRTQDCVPIFLRDDDHRIAGIVHAGWRNVLSGVLIKAIRCIQTNFEIPAKNIFVKFGPSIKHCCFEIKEDVEVLFRENHGNCIHERDGLLYLALGKVLTKQAYACGVFAGCVEEDNDCTFCCLEDSEHKYFSWRRQLIKIKDGSNLGSVATLWQK